MNMNISYNPTVFIDKNIYIYLYIYFFCFSVCIYFFYLRRNGWTKEAREVTPMGTSIGLLANAEKKNLNKVQKELKFPKCTKNI